MHTCLLAFPVPFHTSTAPGVCLRFPRLVRFSQNISRIYAPSLVCNPPIHLNPFSVLSLTCITITKRLRRSPSHQSQATNMPKRAADADLVQPKGAMNAYMHFATNPTIKERAKVKLPTGASVRIHGRNERRGHGRKSDVKGRYGHDGIGRRVTPHPPHALFFPCP